MGFIEDPAGVVTNWPGLTEVTAQSCFQSRWLAARRDIRIEGRSCSEIFFTCDSPVTIPSSPCLQVLRRFPFILLAVYNHASLTRYRSRVPDPRSLCAIHRLQTWQPD